MPLLSDFCYKKVYQMFELLTAFSQPEIYRAKTAVLITRFIQAFFFLYDYSILKIYDRKYRLNLLNLRLFFIQKTVIDDQ